MKLTAEQETEFDEILRASNERTRKLFEEGDKVLASMDSTITGLRNYILTREDK